MDGEPLRIFFHHCRTQAKEIVLPIQMSMFHLSPNQASCLFQSLIALMLHLSVCNVSGTNKIRSPSFVPSLCSTALLISGEKNLLRLDCQPSDLTLAQKNPLAPESGTMEFNSSSSFREKRGSSLYIYCLHNPTLLYHLLKDPEA